MAGTYKNVTAEENAEHMQLQCNRALAVLGALSLMAGDEMGPEFEAAMGLAHQGISKMREVCKRVAGEVKA